MTIKTQVQPVILYGGSGTRLWPLSRMGFPNLLASVGDKAPLIDIGTGEDMTITELAQVVAKIVGYEGKTVFDISKPDGTMRKLMDVSFMTRHGWKASTDMTNGLRKAYAEFLPRVPS